MSELNVWNTLAAWTGAITGLISLVGTWVSKRLPNVVSITPSGSIWILFNGGGPYMLLDLALYAKRQYSLVNAIKIELLHVETCAKFNFMCTSIHVGDKLDFFPIELSPLYKQKCIRSPTPPKR